jgi:hypothetical protein
MLGVTLAEDSTQRVFGMLVISIIRNEHNKADVILTDVTLCSGKASRNIACTPRSACELPCEVCIYFIIY